MATRFRDTVGEFVAKVETVSDREGNVNHSIYKGRDYHKRYVDTIADLKSVHQRRIGGRSGVGYTSTITKDEIRGTRRIQ